jgi:hypothetical protein
MATADPSPASVCPLTLNSTVRLGTPTPPSCFPESGPIQWFKRDVANGHVLSILEDVAGPIALYNAAGQELRCYPDATKSAIGARAAADETYYIAVPTSTPSTCLTFHDDIYAGVTGNIVTPITTLTGLGGSRHSMTTSPTTVFLLSPLSSGTQQVFEIPKALNSTPIVHTNANTSPALSLTRPGHDIKFVNGSLFGLGSATAQTAYRFYRISDGSTWGATPWETSPTPYPATNGANAEMAFAFDGSQFISLSGNCLGSASPYLTPIRIYSHPVSAPGSAVLLASIPPSTLYCAVGIAADSNYLYIAGRGPLAVSGANVGWQKDGIYRFDRTNLAAPPVQIATYHIGTGNHSSLALDDVVNPHYLYDLTPPLYPYMSTPIPASVRVVADPAGSAADLGIIFTASIPTLAAGGDRSFAYDANDEAIYVLTNAAYKAGVHSADLVKVE